MSSLGRLLALAEEDEVVPFRAHVYRAHNPGARRKSPHTYYALDQDTAEAYREEGGVVKKHHLMLHRPLMLDTPEKVKNAWHESGALKVKGHFYPHKQNALNRWAQKRGNDGIVVPHSAFEGEEGYEHAGGTFGEPQAVKFGRTT